MNKIQKYKDFQTITERSKNDPIPEISENKIGIILLGTPGLGKSYFSDNYIQTKRKIKRFSTDDVSLRFTKDPNKYYKTASELNLKSLLTFIEQEHSFIYDTTGTHTENITKVVKSAKEKNYKIIFIHLIGPIELSIRQNLERDRQVDLEYIEYSYTSQFPNMRKYYEELKPDSYYIVYNKDGKYKFYKYSKGNILRRKVDKYVEI